MPGNQLTLKFEEKSKAFVLLSLHELYFWVTKVLMKENFSIECVCVCVCVCVYFIVIYIGIDNK